MRTQVWVGRRRAWALHAEEMSLNGKKRQRSREGEECAVHQAQPDCPLPLLKVPAVKNLLWTIGQLRYQRLTCPGSLWAALLQLDKRAQRLVTEVGNG